MDKKNIIIIGGGISGLSTLHYLRKKYQSSSNISISLLEKNSHIGGVIQSESNADALFETGASSFINNQPHTLELIGDLGLNEQMIEASEDNRIRYLSVNHKLHALPMSPLKLISFPLLSIKDKLSILKERSVKPGINPEESVHDFFSRRFTSNIATLMADPMISGVYAGDTKAAVLKDSFPTVYECEQTYGSVIKGLIAKRKKANEPKKVFSFKKGMHEIVHALSEKYAQDIKMSQDVESILPADNENQYMIQTQDQMIKADQIFLSLPSYQAANIVRGVSEKLSTCLKQINYAPIAVIGLVCSKSDFVRMPKGFGYLKPSNQNSPILGVLFESQIFNHRADINQCCIRLMVGGMHNMHILSYSKEELVALARKELIQTLGFKGEPFHIFFKAWSNAIPQYDLARLKILPEIQKSLSELPHIHITSNFYGGVSVNDCIKSSHDAIQSNSFN